MDLTIRGDIPLSKQAFC